MPEKKGRKEPRKDKLEKVEELSRLIAESPVVGIINIHKMPAAPLQSMRYSLKEGAKIVVTKKELIMRALEKAGEKSALKGHMVTQPGLIFSNMNPFKLYKTIQKSKSKVAAKAGDVAMDDIVAPAGPTDLPPGPAITTLSKVKIQAKVEGGKIAVIKDTVVAKKGDVISPDLAAVLSMLKIQPMEVGLDVTALWENGTIFTKDVLAVDEGKMLGDISLAAAQALNLAVNAGWATKQTIGPMIIKAFINAKTLGLEAGILEKGVIEDLLAKGKRQADALKEKVPE
ncbi:MAG: 50S ribosomal protein L10 [Candidatus Aenigmatarchaeota archaeon]